MATDLNHVTLIGRVTKDVTLEYIGQNAKSDVSIAVNRSKKQNDQWVEEVSYFYFTLWGKTAENLRPYLTKGKQIGFEGHLRQERWEKDGQKFSKVSIVAENVQLLGGKSGNSEADGGQPTTYSSPEAAGYKPQAYQPDSLGGNDFPEDPVF